MKCLNHVLWLLLISNVLIAQNDIPTGSWRTHFSFRDARQVAVTESGVYCASLNTLFFLNFEDQSLKRISKIDGLSDTGISAIAHHADLDVLVIAYANGNIDLLRDTRLTNINTLLQNQNPRSKAVKHILFNQTLAYLATGFGVVVIDLLKNEVMEAYQDIGENGATAAVNFGAIFHDTLFLATEQGVIAGSLDAAINLQDFRNWKRFGGADGLPEGAASTVASNQNFLLATLDGQGIFQYVGSGWQQLDTETTARFLYAASGSPILITVEGRILLIGAGYSIESLAHPEIPNPQSALLGNNGIWVADSINGLATNNTGDFISLFPAGPYSDSISSVHYQGGSIIGLPPGYDDLRNPLRANLGFYFFQDGEWSNFNASRLPKTLFFPPSKDLVDIIYNHSNNKYYLASFGQGIFEWEPNGDVRLLDETSPGSTLENIIPGDRNVFISSIDNDNQGMIWAINYGNANPIHRYDPQHDSWQSYSIDFQEGRYPLDLQIAENGDFWLRLDPLQGGGILVFNPESVLNRHLTTTVDEGGLPSRKINELQIDHDGQVWLGSDKGVFQILFPYDILSNPPVNASPVLIEGRPLLADEPVTGIAVDGGNRKWIGTENGIWLVSPRGDEVINTFNAANSPLPSDRILDVSINHESGEVFIITDLGMVSYRGSATDASDFQNETVRIFPNPVTGEFNGQVGISGLVRNAVVKISDVTGKLVKEIQASGGTAIWDIRDYQGRRVTSGVYLVFSSSSDGNETFVGKIAVIN